MNNKRLNSSFSTAAVLFVLLFISFGVQAQPSLELLEKEYQFGTIVRENGPVKHEFRYRNEGDRPLVIVGTQVNCSCTKVICSKRPLAPGEEAVITVIYDPKRQSGTFYKTITIQSNTPAKQSILVIGGNILN